MKSYRAAFEAERSAKNYDERIYADGSSAEILFRIEAQIIKTIVDDQRRCLGKIDCLDFACGSGRILCLLKAHSDNIVGIDISEAMLERARSKTKSAVLICKDITREEDEVEGQYDVITAFRFLTNAEPELRRAALRGIRRRLRDRRSIFLVNTHSNPWSFRIVFLPYHWIRDRLSGEPFRGYMSNRQAETELACAGLCVDYVIGMGFVPLKLRPFLPEKIVYWIEKRLVGRRIIHKFGVNQLFVCRRANEGMPAGEEHRRFPDDVTLE